MSQAAKRVWPRVGLVLCLAGICRGSLAHAAACPGSAPARLASSRKQCVGVENAACGCSFWPQPQKGVEVEAPQAPAGFRPQDQLFFMFNRNRSGEAWGVLATFFLRPPGRRRFLEAEALLPRVRCFSISCRPIPVPVARGRRSEAEIASTDHVFSTLFVDFVGLETCWAPTPQTLAVLGPLLQTVLGSCERRGGPAWAFVHCSLRRAVGHVPGTAGARRQVMLCSPSPGRCVSCPVVLLHGCGGKYVLCSVRAFCLDVGRATAALLVRFGAPPEHCAWGSRSVGARFKLKAFAAEVT